MKRTGLVLCLRGHHCSFLSKTVNHPLFTRIRLILCLLLCLIYAALRWRFSHVVVNLPNLVECKAVTNKDNGNPSKLCCPTTKRLTLSRIDIDVAPTYLDILRLHPDVCNGSWAPRECLTRQKIAVLIPFRDRELHLRLLLHRLHSVLQHQLIAYKIYVVEQFGNDPFNRGLLMNIGIREALLRDPDINCFIFHDVDLLPENSGNLYLCDAHLRHLSSGIDEFRYHVPFSNYAGGVTALSKKNVFQINGFPNRYWGWGNEDDELCARSFAHGIMLSRPPPYVGQYHAVRHVKSSRGSGHYSTFLDFRGYSNDGLTALSNRSYRLLPNIASHRPRQQQQLNKTGLVFPFSVSRCALNQLTSEFGVPVTALDDSTKSVRYLTVDQERALNEAARSVLYTHLTVDLSPIRAETIRPVEKTRESIFWFLHFYGWI
ncbi:N-acetyllactosaminide 3-alpha-galactosyltransferase [Paragonimus heterotremus]|uniref:Beta-1,4-galactosyltransferase n=1 Tax=Paragonimus heterotremus TaxID=100268 RepID=A0A8J4TBM0_9TREM|nr:N-acetyllactosaminide 3-alpha-galactosyltransferase [Paragonimus heterotremus]